MAKRLVVLLQCCDKIRDPRLFIQFFQGDKTRKILLRFIPSIILSHPRLLKAKVSSEINEGQKRSSELNQRVIELRKGESYEKRQRGKERRRLRGIWEKRLLGEKESERDDT